MAVVFLGLKPTGAILLRVLGGKLALKVHIGWQMTAWFIAFTGVGMGVWLARTMNRESPAQIVQDTG
jgi:predicted MFS family arabinose efflux permease